MSAHQYKKRTMPRCNFHGVPHSTDMCFSVVVVAATVRELPSTLWVRADRCDRTEAHKAIATMKASLASPYKPVYMHDHSYGAWCPVCEKWNRFPALMRDNTNI
jgi:hypothetical protein